MEAPARPRLRHLIEACSRRAASAWLALVLLPGLTSPADARARAAKAPAVVPASLDAVWKEIRRPGAKVVVVNVWATWCEPCRDEMPDILRIHRENRQRGLRLVLISADPQSARAGVSRYLASVGVDFPSFLKVGDDMEFIDGLSPKWDGTLPATLLFDGAGKPLHTWSGSITYAMLKQKLDQLLPSAQNVPSQKRSTP